MRIDEIEVEILIDGQPAKEYIDDDFEQEPVEDEMSKYIEAKEGANFAIQCTVYPSYMFAPAIDYLGIEYLVDGKEVQGHVVTREAMSEGEPTTRTRRGYLTTLERAANENIRNAEAEHVKRYKDLSKLRCKVWREVGGVVTSYDGAQDTTVEDLSNVHQKAVTQRAVSIGTKKDTPRPYQTRTLYKGKKADEEPIATFVFKYRDRGLQKLGIIERSPTPIPLEDRDPSTLTLEELVEAMRRIQAREKEQLAKIKKEKQEANLRQLAGSKRGREDDDGYDQVAEVENPNKKARIEVVDLLDDD